jgi:hypothetical protein
MASHQHRPIDSSKRLHTGAGPFPRCAKQDRGKACPNFGSHMSAQCRCGASGVWCNDAGRWHWRAKTEA